MVGIFLGLLGIALSCYSHEAKLYPVFEGPHVKSPKSEDPVRKSTAIINIGEVSGDESLCSGTLVATDCILTAAHCLTSDSNRKQIVFAAKNSSVQFEIEEGVKSKAIGIQQYWVNPKYGSAREGSDAPFDYALLKLKDRVPAGVAGVRIASDVNQGPLLMAGAGVTKTGIVGQIRSSSVQMVLKGDEGKRILETKNTNQDLFCDGDSGGPIYMVTDKSLLLVGVISQSATLSPPRGEACSGNSKKDRVDQAGFVADQKAWLFNLIDKNCHAPKGEDRDEDHSI